MRRAWPASLAGQVVLIVLLALVVGQGLSLLIFADERRAALRAAGREQMLARTAGLVRLLDETPAELHERILAASSGGMVRFRTDARGSVAAAERWHAQNRLARQLDLLLDGNGGRPVLAEFSDGRHRANVVGFEPIDPGTGRPRYWRPPPGPGTLELAVQLADGRWLNATMAGGPPPAWALPNLVTLTFTAVLVGIGVVLAVRRLTRPLTRLAAAADALGRGEALAPLDETGPADIRRTVQAFNRMQARLRRFVDDRTRMLAAISHDLRTPITSLRLRAEFVDRSTLVLGDRSDTTWLIVRGDPLPRRVAWTNTPRQSPQSHACSPAGPLPIADDSGLRPVDRPCPEARATRDTCAHPGHRLRLRRPHPLRLRLALELQTRRDWRVHPDLSATSGVQLFAFLAIGLDPAGWILQRRERADLQAQARPGLRALPLPQTRGPLRASERQALRAAICGGAP